MKPAWKKGADKARWSSFPFFSLLDFRWYFAEMETFWMSLDKHEYEQSNCFSLPQAPFAENPGFQCKPLFPVSGTVATGWLDHPSVTKYPPHLFRLLSQSSQLACLNRSGIKDNQGCLRKVEELGKGSDVYRNALILTARHLSHSSRQWASHMLPHSQALESKTNKASKLWKKLRPIKSRLNQTEHRANIVQRQWKANAGK